MKKQIWIDGVYDCNGGVQELKVMKVIYENGNPVAVLKENVFNGDIKNISNEDCEDEIDAYLSDRFSEEGFVTKISIE